MKALIDMTRCSGHARCYDTDEEIFQLDEAGYALRSEFEVPADAEEIARQAALGCPERAITLQ